MINKVFATGIEIYAHHGCSVEEQQLGGKFIVDLEVHTDFSKAAITDNLIDTVDYVVLRKIVEEEMKITSKLIEHVGYRIFERIKTTYTNLHYIKVEVHKPNAPVQGVLKDVSIVIEDYLK